MMDPVAINDLQAALSKLSHALAPSAGGASDLQASTNDSNVWGMYKGGRDADQLYDIHIFKEELDAMSRLKRVRALLCELSNSAESEIKTREEKMLPASRKLGLASLSPEIIKAIFELVVLSTRLKRNRAVLSLAHTSKYFRDIALSIPFLWSNITSQDPIDCVVRKLELSKNIPVHASLLFVQENKATSYSFATLDHLRVHAPHSTSLDVRFNYPQGDFDERLQDLEFQSLVSLNLKSVTVTNVSNFPRWRFSSLKKLTVNFYALPQSVLSTVTNLHVDLIHRRKFANCKLPLDAPYVLLDCLESAPALEELSVIIASLDIPPVDEWAQNKLAQLPNVLRLSIRLESLRGVTAVNLKRSFFFTQRLVMPKLISLELVTISKGEMIYWENDICIFPDVLKSLEKLMIRVGAKSEGLYVDDDLNEEASASYISDVLKAITRQTPHLVSLALSFPKISAPLEKISTYPWDRLQSIVVQGHDGWDIAKKIAAKLRDPFRTKSQPSLRSFRINASELMVPAEGWSEIVHTIGTIDVNKADEMIGDVHFVWTYRIVAGYVCNPPYSCFLEQTDSNDEDEE